VIIKNPPREFFSKPDSKKCSKLVRQAQNKINENNNIYLRVLCFMLIWDVLFGDLFSGVSIIDFEGI
jgi:hypothetical protein